jgi:hypothetical protein
VEERKEPRAVLYFLVGMRSEKDSILIIRYSVLELRRMVNWHIRIRHIIKYSEKKVK